MKRLPWCLVLVGVLATAAVAEEPITLVLKQGVSGYTGCADTYIDEQNPASNFGTLWYMHLYMYSDDPRHSILIRFDLDGLIPDGSVIVSATLSVWLYQLVDMSSSNWMSVGPYRLRDYRDWVETETSWNFMRGSTYWSTPGCENTSFDRYATLGSRLYFYNTSSVNTYYHWNVTPSVQAWHAGAQNDG
ncbi:DNRLRE domain-containing protein [bacterium]|nr:DNRLRE domain-containing protein [bacterium]MBU1073619.1 DNRLRE domain-containing protein [bacterium]MBU1676600.1 DNRLRE domain-containing protein [bacterium]